MSRLTLSPYATEQMYQVRRRLNLESQDDLYTLRIAFARSLQEGKREDSIKTEKSSDNIAPSSKRKQIEISTLVKDDGALFRAMVSQFYQKKLTNDEYQELLLQHVEHGLNVIYNETEKFKGYEYLAEIAKIGVAGTDSAKTQNHDAPVLEGFADVIAIPIGTESHSSRQLVINFNKTDEHANNYVGIVGKPGSGKTYFAKYFLTKLRELSRFQTNFIIFDYAKGDIADDEKFVKDTRAQVLKVDETPIPVNIFSLSSLTEREKKRAAERVVEIVKSVEASIGKVQENNLYNAIMSAYERVKSEENPYPDFQLIREELENIKDTADSLISVFRPLTEHNLFVSREMQTWDTLLDKTVVFDIHRLPALRDLCVYLVLNEVYRQLMLLPDSKVNPTSKAREMRTVFVIDEAHHFLKNKKRSKVLENTIREIRSKGASVMLLSQSPDDYDQAEFNYLELLEFVFVLNSNPSSHKFLEQAFGLNSNEAKKLMRDVTELGQGEAFGKGKDRKLTKILLCK